jgi:hypothetical protein
MQALLQARNDSDAARPDIARPVAQKWVFTDNRPEAVAQRKLAEMMNNSPRVLQQRALSDTIHNSPRMVAQRHEMNALFGGAVKPQGDSAMPAEASLPQREEKTNNTGLPNRLKSGIESLSGMSMDHVTVHYNSDKPAQLQAHAYAQGSEIHVGAGQERHLPHEAWHVVQQAQGRVRPTLQVKAGAINDDPSLESEADRMGAKAAQFKGGQVGRNFAPEVSTDDGLTQRVAGFDSTMAAEASPAQQVWRPAQITGLQPVQRTKGDFLKDAKYKVPEREIRKKIHRSVRKSTLNNDWKKDSKKNILVARFVSKDGTEHYNLTTRSAGMGGKHPRGVDGRTAAHTEPQLEALLKNRRFKKRLTEMLGPGWRLQAVFSSNLPCSSSGGGSAKGCGGMKVATLGSPEQLLSTSTKAYEGQKGPNLGRVTKDLNPDGDDTDTESVGSHDSDLDEDDIRGKDMVTDKIKKTWK